MLTVLYERQRRHQEARGLAAESLRIDPSLRAENAALLASGLVAVLGEDAAPGFEALLRNAGLPGD